MDFVFLLVTLKQVQTDKNKVYIIIPVYNEAVTLPEVINGLLAQQYTNLIIIDDGSTQDIRKTIRHLPVIYIRHKVNLGQGASLQTGLDYLKKTPFDAVVTFDGDGQHDPTDIFRLLKCITNDSADIVLGSRFLTNDNSSVPFIRKLILQTARIINFIFSGLLLSDAHNGLRVLNKKAAGCIHFSENRMAHATEILFHIKKHRLRFIELPVNVNYSFHTMGKGQSSLDSVKILFDLVLHKLFK